MSRIMATTRKGIPMKKLRYDLLLIVGVLILAALFWLVTKPGGEGAWAVVSIDGGEVGRYALSEDTAVTFGGEDYNVLQISDGAAAIVEANCGDHTCVRTGKIRREGETIVCLPHKLTVTVVGGDVSEFDAVS